MRRFAYVCADAGIPVPGGKGSSGHVASVCRELERAGLTGRVYAARPGGERLGSLPVIALPAPKRAVGEDSRERETRLFLSGLDGPLAELDDCDFIYERYSLWHVAGLARARALSVPFVLEVNSPLPDEAARFRKLARAGLAEELAGLLLSEADGVVCVSSAVADWVVRHRGSTTGVWTVPNGVDPELFSPGERQRPRPLPPAGVPLIAFCGSFRPWHATGDLLPAMRQLIDGPVPDVHLVCVGDGPERERFESEARELGIADRVHVTGMVTQTEVPDWLRGADVAIAPYGAMDGFYFSPLKIFEFLALGLPVVGADIGQVREILGDGERGLLYPPGDVRGLASSLSRALDHRAESRRLAAAGREWVLATATWKRRVDDILRHIGELG